MLKTLFQFSVQSQKKTKRWYMEHINDFYVKESKRLNLRSRAAFKLMQIQEKYQIYGKKQNILDLGAAPGSWSQVVSENCKVTAVDLIEIEPIQNVHIIIGDILSKQILNDLKQKKFDVILSDMAPNVSGEHNCDHQAILHLNLTTLLCKMLINESKYLLFEAARHLQEVKKKQIMYSQFQVLKDFFQLFFKELVREKPLSSRQDSSEIFYVGKGFQNNILPSLLKEPSKILNYNESIQNKLRKLIVEYKMLE